MGWKSTLMLSREQAKEQLRINLSCLIENIDKLDENRICDLLEETYGGINHGYNYAIIDDQGEFDDPPEFEV